VREFEDELVDDAVDAYRSTHELQVGICGVVEDEVVAIEDTQVVSTDAASELPNSLANVSSSSRHSHLQ
jgi:hypothetical protein